MTDPATPPREHIPGTIYIVHPELSRRRSHDNGARIVGAEDRLAEARGLAEAIDLTVTGTRLIRIANPKPGTLLGSGAVAEIGEMLETLNPEVVFVDHALTPVQQRNLERAWGTKVIDRTGLILEIFADRAHTREGRIQVDLAALEYQRSRLVRSWTHLERQRGGLGKTGGPGETQLEIDRRMIDEQISRLKKDLEQVSRNRELQRKSRERVPFPVVAIVGYTNAGKSTLFNRLTGAEVFAEDLLFATLDPTMRRLILPNGQTVILSDTVGFISDLPTHLIAAFRATLEQVDHADAILHVRDIASPASEAQREDVIAILGDLGIDYHTDARIIEVFNKIDLLGEQDKAETLAAASARSSARYVAFSAVTGEGAEGLLENIRTLTASAHSTFRAEIPFADGEALAWVYDHAHIIAIERLEDRTRVQFSADAAIAGRFRDRYPDYLMEPSGALAED